MDRGAWQAAVHGVAKSQDRAVWLSTAQGVAKKKKKNLFSKQIIERNVIMISLPPKNLQYTNIYWWNMKDIPFKIMNETRMPANPAF